MVQSAPRNKKADTECIGFFILVASSMRALEQAA